jgi:hypothetical protein
LFIFKTRKYTNKNYRGLLSAFFALSFCLSWPLAAQSQEQPFTSVPYLPVNSQYENLEQNKDLPVQPEPSKPQETAESKGEAKDDDLTSPVSIDTEGDNNQAKFEGDDVNYDPETGIFIIQGAATLELPKQGIKLAADRIEYYPKDEKLKAIGNVLITGRDQVTFAKSLDLNLKDNKALLGDVKSQITMASIEAREGSLSSSASGRTGNYTNGYFDLATPVRMGGLPKGITSFRLQQNQIADAKELLADGQSYTLSARKVVYYPDRIQNNLQIYGGRLKFKKLPITLPLPYGVFTAGESTQQMFGVVLGNSPRTGAGDFNVGPKISLVVGDPKKKRAISAAPFAQFGSDIGYGGMLQYSDPRNSALIGYGNIKRRGIAEVSSRITKYNNFVYGWNSYLGGGITKQFAQLNDRRSFKMPILGSFLEGDKINLSSDLTLALDSQELRNQENNRYSRLQQRTLGINSQSDREKFGLRAQQTLSFSTKPIIEFGTEKYNAAFRIASSSTARIYSTGNVNAFTSVSPNVTLHAHRYADLQFGYNQLLPVGRSPFGFDQVIEGQSSVFGNGDLNLTKWLSVGAYSVYSLSLRSIVAQQFRLVIGPEDFKILAGYDPIRRQFNFGFNILFDDKVGFRQFSYRKNASGKKRRF